MKTIDFRFNQLKTHFPVLLLLIFLIPSTGASAKTTAPDAEQKNATFQINKDTLKAKIEAIKTREGLDDATKSKILSIYQIAEDNLANTDKYKAQSIEFNGAIKQAPEQTKKLQNDLKQTQPKASKQKMEDFDQIPNEELEQRLILEKEKISNLDGQINALENELATQNNRPKLIHEETLIAQQDLEGTQKKIGAPAGKSEAKLDAEARLVQLKTVIESRTAELKMLDAEAASNPFRVDLLKTKLQLLDMQKAALSPVVATIENIVFERRQQEAKQMQDALSETEKEVSGKHPLIQQVTRENIQYSLDLQNITIKNENYSEQKTKVDAQNSEIETDFKSAEKKISLAGLSPALGKILREQRRNLPVQNEFEQQSETIQNETAITSLAQFKVDYNLKQMVDIDTELKDMMTQQVDQNLPVDQRMMIQAQLRILLNSQKDLLNKLSIAYTAYLHTLGDLDFARQQMITQAGKFAVYLDERLLWVPSSEPINLSYVADLYHSAQWLLAPLNWMVMIKDAVRAATHHLFLNFVAILCFAGLYLIRKRAKLELLTISDKVGKIHTDSFYYTLKGLAYNLMLALPLPLIFNYLGWLLSRNVQVDDFTKAVGEGLHNSALPMFFLQFFYYLFALDGIAHKHFQWQKGTVKLLHRQIAWIRFVMMPGMFIIGSTSASKFSAHSDSIGRLALIVIMAAMAVFLGWLLKPSSGLLKNYIERKHDGWTAKLRYAWYSATIFTPLIIIGFAVEGYYLSALELQQKLIITLLLSVWAAIIHALVFRWLTLVNRQLAIANARQKRKTAAITEKHLPAGPEDPSLPAEDHLIDIPKINAQTINLLNVFIGFMLIIGFWMIWKNILPAFSFLERIVLWQNLVNIDNQESYQAITLLNLLLAGLYTFITVVSIRNFSGLMELLLFRRLSINEGGRYAVDQLAKYVIFSIGFISVANQLGGSWSQVQWLVAALSVGLGFGLQEIFANMVSGIILLFERPIRVGDTVSIGTITGKVTRIHMRATTLIDGDKKEVVVPNKTFITSQLINWTLSDSITRIVIPVGIAYGSDVELAHKVMLDTVRSTPLVLATPEPSVVLIGFGDSALNFSINIFVNELSNRTPVMHSLLVRLENAFREHHIEIPFPQQDIHIRPADQENGKRSKDGLPNTIPHPTEPDLSMHQINGQ